MAALFRYGGADKECGESDGVRDIPSTYDNRRDKKQARRSSSALCRSVKRSYFFFSSLGAGTSIAWHLVIMSLNCTA